MDPHESLNQRIKQLQRLLEVSRDLSAMLDLEPLLQTIIDEAVSLTNSQEASILLYEEQEEMLKFVAVPWGTQEKMGNLLVPIEGSISGNVYKTGQAAVVEDVAQDKRFFKEIDAKREFTTKNMLVVPLIFQGKPTGVLTAVNKRNGAPYNDEDVRILETLASQASIAINNANLMQQSQQAYEDLAELDRRKSDFIAITSHELRTPLGLILGHATFIKEMIPDDLKEQMDVIVRSTMRLKSIVEDLSKVNNFQTGQARLRWREINVKDLLEEVVHTFEGGAEEKGITLQLDMPRKELQLVGDGEKIGIAVSHLVRNAITFTDHGGVRVAAEELPGYVKIAVADTGIGIPEKDQNRVFERFYQVETHMTRRHGGMGLGLSVAKMMVEMHSGRITLNSDEGRGTTITLLFPRTGVDMNTANELLKSKTVPVEK
jgi:signal transduction histidine kinase